MRIVYALLSSLIIIAAVVHAQGSDDTPSVASSGNVRVSCSGVAGAERSRCMADAKRATPTAAPSGTSRGLNSKDISLINDTASAAQEKMSAGDFAGAVLAYRQAISGTSKSPVLFRLTAGLAVAERRQAVAAYNAGPQPSYPPAGAGNEVIRAANAANAAIQVQKTASALPLLKEALATAARAAMLADAQSDRTADDLIETELREDAGLLYALDRAGVLATPRNTIDIEVVWFNRWFGVTSPLAEALAAKYGFATAAALTAKDKPAGVALAENVRARTGTDVDGMLGYADVLIAAQIPAGDPRRVKALTDLKTAEPAVTDGMQLARLRQLKVALAATS